MNERNKPIVQDPETRRHNFDEVSLGFDRQRMIDEANRCLGCKNAACVTGCPVEVNIPLFIAALKTTIRIKLLRSSTKRTVFLPYAGGYVLRRSNVKASA